MLNEGGAQAVFPKIFKCRNCGLEFAVESFEDMAANLPTFQWLESPPNPPACFQFFCPNQCGAGYTSSCWGCRQLFHSATHVMYGGADLTCADFGDRQLVDPEHFKGLSLEEASRLAPRASAHTRPAGRGFRFRKQPRRGRDEGDSDGTVSAS